MIDWTEVKVSCIAVSGILIERFAANPIGVATAIVVLLYTFEKYRTQRSIRKKQEDKDS